MDKVYKQEEVEQKWYKFWEENGYFKPEINPDGKPYSIVLPPPNVTGTLHIGHALTVTIEDILIRYHRMKGFKTLWLPGTDHAAIATQSKVESILYEQEGKTRHDLGREKFLQEVQEFAQNSHDTIVTQLRSMGASLDWDREAYTLDKQRNLAVKEAFKRMYDNGLIYRGNTIVNWDPYLSTTVSDDEIEWRQQKTPLYYLQYGPFVITTARPETKFGDKYVVMHPKDKRYKDYKDGQKTAVEWINGQIVATIVKDESIDMEFGTGLMTITPWHDKTDFEIAGKHNLDMEQIIDLDGKLLPIAGECAGEHIKKARARIVEKLKQKNLLVKVDENYTHRLATNYRGGGVIEPQVMKQWMINVNKQFIQKGKKVTLKRLMRDVVESGQIKIIPQRFVKIYYHWIDNLRDWCISRQIWYGHRIPVWYRGEETYVGVDAPKEEGWQQDPDTLDTWFSSGLWTFSTLGWPKDTDDLNSFHPTSVLETGYDILFFWVARMILMTTSILGDVPFKEVYLHGIVRDAQKQKMSKSKGNVIDPLDMTEKYGTDALRVALIFGTAAGNDIPMSEDKIRGMRNFTNKLWNLGRFIDMNKIPGVHFQEINVDQLLSSSYLENSKDIEIVRKVNELAHDVTVHLNAFQLHHAMQKLYDFTWHELADKYIEDVKGRVDGKSYMALTWTFNTLLKLLHPFMPYITEELWQKLPHEGESIMISKWPI